MYNTPLEITSKNNKVKLIKMIALKKADLIFKIYLKFNFHTYSNKLTVSRLIIANKLIVYYLILIKKKKF